MSKVFVSHKDVDEALARRVAQRVRQNGLGAYLDSVDPALERDGPELADYLLARMSECEQLIAVVSSATSTSWWVPWEIGVGSEKGFRMASYSERLVNLPTYLQKWPDLHSLERRRRVLPVVDGYGATGARRNEGCMLRKQRE